MCTLLVSAIAACVPPATTAGPPAPQPTPDAPPTATEPSSPTGPTETPTGHGGPWTFAYTPGQFTYTIQTDAQVAQLPDSSTFRPIPRTTQSVTIERTDTGVTVIMPPPPQSLRCDSVAALYTRASSLLVPLPTQLSAGATWTDSSSTNGCRGTIPTTTMLKSMFTVIGDTTYNDRQVLLIVRRDTIVARGEGNEGPHRILLSAQGSGSTSLYYDVVTGRFIGAEGSQSTQVDITTSGRTSQFLQRVQELITLTTP